MHIATQLELPGVSIVLSAAVAIIGVLVYGFAGNPKLQRIGELSFFAGLLSFLLLFR